MSLNPTYRFPASALDDAEALRAMIGSFWTEFFGDDKILTSLLAARAQLEAQTQLDIMELLHSISRFSVPVYHTDNWYLLTLRESTKDAVDLKLPQFGADYNFADPATISFGEQLSTPVHAWAAPPDLTFAPVILNRIVASSLSWINGVDYVLQDGVFLFRSDPFENELVAIRDVYDGPHIVDREAQLWIYRGQFDWNTIYNQFGYALRLRLASSPQYKQLLNAVFDALAEGSSNRTIRTAVSALVDVPLAESDEIVETVTRDAKALWIITDKRAYEFNRDADPLVAVGNAVQAGQPLVDALQFFEFNRGQVPPSDVVPSLSLGKGYLSAGYFADLVFENQEYPLTVIAPSPETGNYTRIEFPVRGAPADVEKFWDDVHNRGVARGETLAMLLDRRTNKIDQPTGANLPTTINPLEFLCQNLLRANYQLAVIRLAKQGRGALGLQHGRILRKIVPPQTTLLIYVALEFGRDEITMDGPGDDTKPGVEESFSTFRCGTYTDAIDPADYVTETVRFRQIIGLCE